MAPRSSEACSIIPSGAGVQHTTRFHDLFPLNKDCGAPSTRTPGPEPESARPAARSVINSSSDRRVVRRCWRESPTGGAMPGLERCAPSLPQSVPSFSPPPARRNNAETLPPPPAGPPAWPRPSR